MGVGIVDGLRGYYLAILVHFAIDILDDELSRLVKSLEVLHQHLGSAALVAFPAVQLDGNTIVGEAQCLVELCHVGLIDALDGELARPDVIVADEVGVHLVACLQMQLVSHHAGDEQGVVRLVVAELWHLALHYVLLEEADVIVASDAFEGYTQEVFVSLEDSLRHGEALHMAYTRSLLDSLEQGVADADR